ncbi:MAG TPA: hypothetical protein VE631_02565 [Alphaproteobacteria bacterium]|nr:hypothetical protein [Alphaproteobacteria bacterium]
MSPERLAFAAVLVAVANGLFSPALGAVATLAPLWIPGFVPLTPVTVLYAASLALSTATLLLAGVPAALYEHLRGQPASSTASTAIWLAGTVLLSLPALLAHG